MRQVHNLPALNNITSFFPAEERSHTMLTLLLVTAVALVAVATEGKAAVEVKMRQGVFRGEALQVGSGRQVYSFRGIPYGVPPVGTLRFKDPQPLEAWEGVKDSFTPPQCPQTLWERFIKGETVVGGEEDCLYLHVYTPKLEGSDLPVMVYIHGGGYLIGNPDTAGGSPVPLLTRDVVLVSLQYRLGTLGFLSTGDSVLPGNMGLKDQTLALRWVQDNIRCFGGDPGKVTIFGESAGGASVHLQMYTPQAEGLFQRVIMQSGSSLCPWAMRNDHKSVAASVSRLLGCTGVEAADGSLNSLALLECLQAAPVDQLVLAASLGPTWNFFPFYMVPRVDGEFLPAHPALLLREGRYHKADVITGICLHEGAYTTLSTLSTPSGEELLSDFFTVGPISVGMDEEEHGAYITSRLYYHYLGPGNIAITPEKAEQLVKLYGDSFHVEAHDLTARLHARDTSYGKNVYLYQLEHRGEQTVDWDLETDVDFQWVAHSDDIQYLFNDTFGGRALKRPDNLLLREIMLDLWTNFAATGNPTPDLSLGFRWSPASSSNLHYLSLRPAPIMRPDPNEKLREFFGDLPTRHNMLLFPEKFGVKAAAREGEGEGAGEGVEHTPCPAH